MQGMCSKVAFLPAPVIDVEVAETAASLLRRLSWELNQVQLQAHVATTWCFERKSRFFRSNLALPAWGALQMGCNWWILPTRACNLLKQVQVRLGIAVAYGGLCRGWGRKDCFSCKITIGNRNYESTAGNPESPEMILKF